MEQRRATNRDAVAAIDHITWLSDVLSQGTSIGSSDVIVMIHQQQPFVKEKKKIEK
jgi:hypothetical protein